jgi:hypothetical protein
VESDWGPYGQPLGERKSTGLEASHGVSCSLTREGTRIDSLSKLITGTNLHHECYTYAQSATLQRKKKWQPEWTRTPAPARSQKYLPVSAPAEKLPGDVRTALDRFIHSCLLGKSHRGPANIPSRPQRLKKKSLASVSVPPLLSSAVRVGAARAYPFCMERPGPTENDWSQRDRRAYLSMISAALAELIRAAYPSCHHPGPCFPPVLASADQ